MTLHLIDDETFRRSTLAYSEARALLAQSDIETQTYDPAKLTESQLYAKFDEAYIADFDQQEKQ